MKVNISGRGRIPGVGTLAPVYGFDATKEMVARIINYKQFHVYEAATGTYITKSNIDTVFAPKVDTKKEFKVGIATDESLDTPYKSIGVLGATPVVDTLPNATPDMLTDAVPVPATKEILDSVTTTETTLPEITDDAVTEERVAEPVDEAVEVEDDTIDTDDSSEETVATEENKPNNNYYTSNKKNKKNRNKYNNNNAQ